MVHVCIILVDFGFRGLVVTYFDFWWSQRLFSEKAVGKRVVGSGSVTKLAIDQLKPRRSSLSATSVCAVQASAPQYIAIHCPSALSTRPCTAFSVYVITLHCVGASEHRLIWRRPLRTEAMSRYRWEPQHLRNQCTMRQPVHYEAKYNAVCNRIKH